jgi:hypothetical protein
MGWIFIQQQLPRKFENDTIRVIIWTTMPHTAQLDRARRESYIWSRHCWWGWSNGTLYLRQLKSHKVTPRELCKQEMLTFTVWGWRSCVLEGFTNEGRKEVWSERKASPRYIESFLILEKCGNVAYKLELPLSLVEVHDIFHVSLLKKCLKAPVDVVLPEVAPLETDLTYPKHPIKMLNKKSRVTRHNTIKFYKVQWSNHTVEEATWESEISSVLAIWISSYHSEGMCDCSLSLFKPFLLSNLGTRFCFRGEGCNIPSL